MAFPANYNIQYYQGDTYQFVIRPKTSAGEVFPVTPVSYDAYFRIDTQRGRPDGLGIEAPASIGENFVTCTITPLVGNSLVAGTTYFYDVSVEDKSDPNSIFTLLTGTITITADIAAGP
jgi:hypothetical protein